MKGLANQNLLKFCYSDSTSDKADGLDIEIADPYRTWMQQHMPKKGIECKAGFIVYNWLAPGDDRTFEMGIFYINCIEYKGGSQHGNTITIKGSSIPVQSRIKNEKKHKSWEKSDLKSIAGQVAKQNGLILFYDTQQNPTVKRTDQIDKSDLQYLRDRCKEAALSLKIHNKQLVIYSEEEYDQRDAIFTITYGKSNVIDWEFISKVDDTYKEAQNSYVDPETGKLVKEKFTPDESPEGSYESLNLNERNETEPDDPDPNPGGDDPWPQIQMGVLVGVGERTGFDALSYDFDGPAQSHGKGKGSKQHSKRKCKSKLRQKNKKEKESKIKVVGDPMYLSSLNIQLIDWGIFSDKWFISEAKHDIDQNGYTVELNLRKTLKGY